MIERSKRWPLFFLSVTVVAITLLSAGLSGLELLPGRSFPVGILSNARGTDSSSQLLPGLLALSIDLWVMLAILAVLFILLLWIIVFIIRPKARKHMLTRMISYLLLLLIISGLIDAFRRQLDKAGETNETDSSFASGPLEAVATEAVPVPPAFIIDPPQWLVVTITLILIALFLIVAWFLWRHRPRKRTSPVELLAQEAQQAIEALQASSDLKNTVMRCYLEMSRVLREQQGIQRQKAMTPREFENHLSEIGLRNEHIRRLTRLFEAVRYGANLPGEREEREAVACLTAIVQAYGRSS